MRVVEAESLCSTAGSWVFYEGFEHVHLNSQKQIFRKHLNFDIGGKKSVSKMDTVWVVQRNPIKRRRQYRQTSLTVLISLIAKSAGKIIGKNNKGRPTPFFLEVNDELRCLMFWSKCMGVVLTTPGFWEGGEPDFRFLLVVDTGQIISRQNRLFSESRLRPIEKIYFRHQRDWPS